VTIIEIINRDVQAGRDYSQDDVEELCLRCGHTLGTKAIAIEERDDEVFVSVEFVCGDCAPDAERTIDNRDLIDEYWQWCRETPCIFTVHTFLIGHQIDDATRDWFGRYVANIESDQCHPTGSSVRGCREGTRTDCHWCNNHKPKAAR